MVVLEKIKVQIMNKIFRGLSSLKFTEGNHWSFFVFKLYKSIHNNPLFWEYASRWNPQSTGLKYKHFKCWDFKLNPGNYVPEKHYQFVTSYEDILEYINNNQWVLITYDTTGIGCLVLGEKQWRGGTFVICFKHDCSSFIDRYPF